MYISAVLLAIAATLVSCVHVAKLWARRAELHRQIDKIPGPPSLPIVGTTYHFFRTPRNGLLKLFCEIAKNYWPIFRLWMGSKPVVGLIKPQHFEAVISGAKHLRKSSAYRFLEPLLGTGLVTSSGEKWHSHRKMITPAFHLSILESFLPVFWRNCDILVEKLEKTVGGAGFDIYPYIAHSALDIICETAMGVRIHAQEDAESEYVKAVSELGVLIVYRRERLWLHPDFIFYNTPMGRRFKKCLDIVQGFSKRVIQERKTALLPKTINFSQDLTDGDNCSGLGRKKAFLDLLLEASGKEGKLTDEEIREEVDTFMTAGYDTTAASIAWVLFMLGHHPEIQEEVFAELEEIFQGSHRHATMKDLHEMKFMDRVIKETMRLYPTIPFVHRVLSESICVDDYVLPAGTTVSILIYFANRNPEYFPNPEEFNPDNFLPDRVQNRHHFAFVPFSAGPRNCIGQKFALLEGKTMLSSILRKFRIRSLQKREDVNAIPEIVLRPEHGIKVALALRT